MYLKFDNYGAEPSENSLLGFHVHAFGENVHSFGDGAVRSTARPASTFLRHLTNAAGAAVLLILLSPLFLLTALAIKMFSHGPVFFRQERCGKGGVLFTLYKFRTMHCMEDGWNAVQCVPNDSRLTPLGAFLRRTSIDELPQLLNVVRGEMAMIGPRPHPIGLDRHFAMQIPGYYRRYAVKPGLTGLAQIRGQRGPTGKLETMAARVASDLEYVRNQSFAFDLGILLRTFPAIIRGENAI